MRPMWTVARRELKALFDTPAGYVLLVVFIRCQIMERQTSFAATIRALSKPSEYDAG